MASSASMPRPRTYGMTPYVGRPVNTSIMSRPGWRRETSPRKRFTTIPWIRSWSWPERSEHAGECGEDTAWVYVSNQNSGKTGGAGEAQIHDVAVAQVDLGRAAPHPRRHRPRRTGTRGSR